MILLLLFLGLQLSPASIDLGLVQEGTTYSQQLESTQELRIYESDCHNTVYVNNTIHIQIEKYGYPGKKNCSVLLGSQAQSELAIDVPIVYEISKEILHNTTIIVQGHGSTLGIITFNFTLNNQGNIIEDLICFFENNTFSFTNIYPEKRETRTIQIEKTITEGIHFLNITCQGKSIIAPTTISKELPQEVIPKITKKTFTTATVNVENTESRVRVIDIYQDGIYHASFGLGKNEIIPISLAVGHKYELKEFGTSVSNPITVKKKNMYFLFLIVPILVLMGKYIKERVTKNKISIQKRIRT